MNDHQKLGLAVAIIWVIAGVALYLGDQLKRARERNDYLCRLVRKLNGITQ